ncbi:glycosyltransferase family 25 protein, partial [Yoonia sp.]|uniref:glycosyltransferase family 25 protein n=1 Tax=Yoonia sp. TaxID=2212373 RepID=UPI002FDB3D69
MSLTRDDIGVWLINLPRDTDRRHRMERQLADLGLPYVLLPAVDGRAEEDRLIRRADPAAYSRNMGSPLLPGKLGVYASHLAVWEALIASNHRAALILEDDVVFHDDFMEALETALRHDSLWDVVRFNCIRAKLPVTQARLGPYRLNAYLGPFTGNACYLIHRDVARRLLPALWPQTRALDHELNRFFLHDYRQMGLEPWSSHPDDQGTSSITGTNFSLVKKPKWWRRLPYYQNKATNYARRAIWLRRHGML